MGMEQALGSSRWMQVERRLGSINNAQHCNGVYCWLTESQPMPCLPQPLSTRSALTHALCTCCAPTHPPSLPPLAASPACLACLQMGGKLAS